MVLKPSPFTPLSCLRFGELTREVLPAGVLNVLSGSDQVGAWMSEHPIPRMTSFTGSVATGKRVAAAAATDLKRITLELGGNDPAIILDDADVSKVADGLFTNAFGNCGQICVAIKRGTYRRSCTTNSLRHSSDAQPQHRWVMDTRKAPRSAPL